MQEKYPQPKPEVFSQRKDMMENQVNVNSSRVQGLHLTVRLAWNEPPLWYAAYISPAFGTSVRGVQGLASRELLCGVRIE